MRGGIQPAPAEDHAMSVTLTRRSQGPGPQEFNGQSAFPDLSADGLCVVFSSEATNAFLADANGVPDIWRQNRDTSVLERVSSTTSGQASDGASFSAVVSGDGRYVAFTSLATNLTLNDSNGFADVFRKDMDTGAVLLVSSAPDGLPANSVSFGPAISADGRYVAFLSAAGNIVNDDSNLSTDVFLKDMVTSKTRRVDLAADGTEASAGAISRPALSADGRYVAFDSTAANLTANDANTGTQTGTDGPDLMVGGDGADRLIGLGGDDTLDGRGGSDTLEGGEGNNVMMGGPGNDAMIGGAGDDIYQVDAPGDAVVEQEDGGTDTVFVAISGWALSANIEIARLTGAANSLIGSADEAQLVANAALGSTLEGGGGNDVLWGQGLADSLLGGGGDDVLRGGGGNDVMDGGDGNDQAVIEQPGDAFIEARDGGIDTAWVTASGWTLAANVEIGRLAGNAATLFGSSTGQALVANPLLGSVLAAGDGADELWGSELADTLSGGGGDDTLRGGAGDDIMRGGTGNDTSVVDSTGDRVEELAGGGADTVYVTANGWVMGANIEVAYLAGTATRISGSEGSESIVANPLYASTIDGRAGDDTAYGSPFGDVLAGGLGNDVLWGLAGADLFAFHIANWGQDWVMDFARAEGDRLDFRGSGVLGFSQLSLIANGPNTILLFGNQAVTLRGVTDIGGADCVFYTKS